MMKNAEKYISLMKAMMMAKDDKIFLNRIKPKEIVLDLQCNANILKIWRSW